MKISKTQTELLRRLMSGDSVAASSLRNDLVEELLGEGLLTTRDHGSRRSYAAIDTVALGAFVESHFGGLKIVDKVRLTRAEIASETGDSKLVMVRSCPGFPVNTYEPISCMLNGQEFMVNPKEGSFLFVADWQSFFVPDDVVVVGIENMENFRMIRQQRKLFEQCIGTVRLLFVSRYPQSIDLRSWLQKIPNRYVHFGDFDLAGINIFLTEFHAHLGAHSSFLIPQDIEERIAKGSLERYNDQYARYNRITSDIKEVQALIDLINKYHRCYDQEGYIGSVYLSV